MLEKSKQLFPLHRECILANLKSFNTIKKILICAPSAFSHGFILVFLGSVINKNIKKCSDLPFTNYNIDYISIAISFLIIARQFQGSKTHTSSVIHYCYKMKAPFILCATILFTNLLAKLATKKYAGGISFENVFLFISNLSAKYKYYLFFGKTKET